MRVVTHTESSGGAYREASGMRTHMRLKTQTETNGDAYRETSDGAYRETSGDAYRETSGDAYRKTSGDAYRETSGNAHRETSGDAYRETSGDAYRETSGDAHRETSGDAYRETSGDAYGEMSGDAHRETSGDAYRETSGDDYTEYTRLLPERKTPSGIYNSHKIRKKASTARRLMVMVAGLVQQLVSVGLGFGLSIMYVELIAVFDASRSTAALIQGMYLGLTAGAGILLTGVIKKVGPGPTIIVGSIIASVGLFASSFAENVSTIIALTGFVAGMGMCVCYLSAFITISWMFHEDPGFPLVCLTIGSSIGQFTIPYLYEVFISEYTWSGTFVLVSGIALQCVPCGVLIYTSREFYVTNSASDDETKEAPTCSGYMPLLKDVVMCILLVDFLLMSLTGNVEAWFIVDIITSRGYTREAGSILVTALGFANFLGRVSGCILRYKCKTIPTVYHWLWICPIVAVGHALVISLTDYWAIFAACIMQGTIYGMNNSQAPTIVVEASGLENYPQAMSLVNLMFGCGSLFSNMIGGVIRDRFGEYNLYYYISVGVSLFVTLNSAVVSCIIHRRKRYRNGIKIQYSALR